jgi:predicted GIY-YIG superfamily endonuclease
MWYVYVLRSLAPRYDRRGRLLVGFHYVGSTTDVRRRLRQHNGEIVGGAKWTAKHRPHILVAVYGTYVDRSEALRAELALKRGKRGVGRTRWSPTDSKWCRGLGADDPLVDELALTCVS